MSCLLNALVPCHGEGVIWLNRWTQRYVHRLSENASLSSVFVLMYLHFPKHQMPKLPTNSSRVHFCRILAIPRRMIIFGLKGVGERDVAKKNDILQVAVDLYFTTNLVNWEAVRNTLGINFLAVLVQGPFPSEL